MSFEVTRTLRKEEYEMNRSLMVVLLIALMIPAMGHTQTVLQSNVVNGTSVRLSWSAAGAGTGVSYRVYRGLIRGFAASESTLVTETAGREYLDRNLKPYTAYYYRVVPAAAGKEPMQSPEIRVETYRDGVVPTIMVRKASASPVKKFETFELALDLANVGIENPYNPADIDVYALFTSPGGTTIRINGFYDDFRGTATWKVRFSPETVGTWRYQAYVRDAGGTSQTASASLTVSSSDHHGWIRQSNKNPHYFEYADGAPYFGVGVYSPWGNNDARFENLAAHNANLFAIWDIGYGGFVNDKGIIEEQLGRYNQEKLGMMDSLIVILETRNIEMMYAIWPHDLFSASVWTARWDINPYHEIVSAVNVYGDSLAWEYEKMKYRYMIARFSSSRSMGIWELINEMDGTDGWAKGHQQDAYDWVEKSVKWFAANDPYHHPVTASFSGGFTQYREPLYERTDIPNIHMYPAQGWEKKYPDDVMRSEMYDYAWAARRFFERFNKPAIFGEAGANLAYFNPKSPEYHESYHNAIWASLSNGLSCTPVWWEYSFLNAQDWEQLGYLAHFVSDIDFTGHPYTLADIAAEGADVFGLAAGTDAFGWVRSYTKADIGGTPITLNGMANGAFDVIWFDPWGGTVVGTDHVTISGGQMKAVAPALKPPRPDIAFKIRRR
jgi:hypothetical protein